MFAPGKGSLQCRLSGLAMYQPHLTPSPESVAASAVWRGLGLRQVPLQALVGAASRVVAEPRAAGAPGRG